MITTIHIDLTDLVNDILIEKGKHAVKQNHKGITAIVGNNRAEAREIVETAIATYYNYVFTGEFREIEKINYLPQFRNINAKANYDLERLD